MDRAAGRFARWVALDLRRRNPDRFARQVLVNQSPSSAPQPFRRRSMENYGDPGPSSHRKVREDLQTRI